jgi:hypothetical protein
MKGLLVSFAPSVTLADVSHPLGAGTIDHTSPPPGCDTTCHSDNNVDTILNVALMLAQRLKKLNPADDNTEGQQHALQNLLKKVVSTSSSLSHGSKCATRLSVLLHNLSGDD